MGFNVKCGLYYYLECLNQEKIQNQLKKKVEQEENKINQLNIYYLTIKKGW